MTESEWLAWTRAEPMLRFLIGTTEPRVVDVESFPDCRASDRKLRLFACACYHRICHLLPDPLARAAVVVAEEFADGLTTGQELEAGAAGLGATLYALEPRWRASRGAERAALAPRHGALALAFQITRPEAPKAAYYASSNAYLAVASIRNPGAASYDRAFTTSQAAEERAQTSLLRELFGPLLFRPVVIEPSWRTADVVRLARSAYEAREFEHLPILADALEEAGCNNEELLRHLRGAGPHVPGCWAVDLILGRG
ncbi:MAG: hypothetical protein L0Z62_23630 [Gemmataceae bacterium]|nr:hypothetical protein [Gemmataceae bacterium]